jgi:hypothetical protein
MVPDYINGILNNYGVPFLPFMKLYFVALPFIYAVHLAFRNRTIRAPYIIEFTILFVIFVALESSLVRIDPSPNYDFIVRLSGIYILFLILTNVVGNSRTAFKKVLDYAILNAGIICFSTLAGYAGLIRGYAIGFDFLSDGIGERPYSEVNVNIISYICAFSMYLVVVRMLNFKRTRRQRAIDFLLHASFFLLIIVNSSRGAFIVASLIFGHYVLFLWRFSDTKKGSLLLIVLPACAFLATMNFNFSSLQEINLVERYHDTPEGRLLQMIVSWENFLNEPVIGHGYESAGKSYNSYTTRSNFMYTQILAAGGLLLFLPFLYTYYYKMLIGKLRNLVRPEVGLAFLFNFISFMFTRQFYYFGIFVFIVYYTNAFRTVDYKVTTVMNRRRFRRQVTTPRIVSPAIQTGTAEGSAK